MNNTVKFHKANGPSFNKGEVWVAPSGSRVIIDGVRRFGFGKWDYEVSYHWIQITQDENGNNAFTRVECSKDAWNFQVKYQHIADLAFNPLKKVDRGY